MNKVISLSYLIEDGVWCNSNNSMGEEEWMSYILGDMSREVDWGYGENGEEIWDKVIKCVSGIVDDMGENFESDSEGWEEGYKKSLKEKKEEMLKWLDEERKNEYSVIRIRGWSVEYDDNVSVLLFGEK